MKRHDRKYLDLLSSLGLEVEIFARYVDDETEGMASVDNGVRFDGVRLRKMEDFIESDKLLEADIRTMLLLKTISNSITKCVQYTVDCPSLNQDLKVPVLDLKVSVRGEIIVHEF